jgi:hypothetical protein
MPGMPELERLSGRMPVDIRTGLKELTEGNYIEWNPNTPPEMACIISGWEKDNPSHRDPEEVIKNNPTERIRTIGCIIRGNSYAEKETSR